MVDSTGSAEAIVLPSQTYTPRGAAEAGFVANYADVVPGTFIYSARVGYAGSLLDWLRTVLARPGQDGPTYAELEAEIPQPLRFSGLLVFPSFGRVVTPFWERHAAPGMVAGLDLSHTRGHLTQALLEGVTYSLRANVEWLESLEAPRVSGSADSSAASLLVEGGATRNQTWMQLKADILGRPVEAVTLAEPTALGAALQAGIGAGLYADHAEAARVAAGARVETRTSRPDARRVAVYDDVFRRGYLAAAASQADLNRVLQAANSEVTNEHRMVDNTQPE